MGCGAKAFFAVLEPGFAVLANRGLFGWKAGV